MCKKQKQKKTKKIASCGWNVVGQTKNPWVLVWKLMPFKFLPISVPDSLVVGGTPSISQEGIP